MKEIEALLLSDSETFAFAKTRKAKHGPSDTPNFKAPRWLRLRAATRLSSCVCAHYAYTQVSQKVILIGMPEQCKVLAKRWF